MIPARDVADILLISLVAALVVGLLALAALRVARRATMVVQLAIVTVGSILTVASGMIAVAQAMYVSIHDLTVMFWVAGVSSIVALGVAVVLGRSFTRNSDRVRALARSLAEGRRLEPVDGRNDRSELAALEAELSVTSRRLSDARDEVAQIDESRREVVAWISHDLRTPLAAIRAMAEALTDEMVDDPSRYHRQMLGQVDRLSIMVDDLFELSKIHSGTVSLSMEPVSLYDLVSDAVADLGALARSRSVTLTENGGHDLIVVGDPRGLARVVGNLLINAIQHSPPGEDIAVTTRRTPDGDVVLSVEDAGGGIAEDDLDKVFVAGWRQTSARTPDEIVGRSSGAGFGLAIVQGIVDAHSGDVTVRNIPGGCRFDVRLPQHRPAAV